MPMTTGSGPSEFRKTTLDSGLRVVTAAMPHTRSVCVDVFMGIGSRHEESDHAGVSHMLEHLVFKGTRRRPAPLDISGAVEGVGGVMNAGTEQELTHYWCKVALPHLDETLDLLFDMLRCSRLDPADIEKEKVVVLDELGLSRDYPGDRVESLIDEMLWPGHPLGRDIGGTKETVSGLSRDTIVDHLERYYCPANAVVSVAGDVEHDWVVGRVQSLSAGWQRGEEPRWEPYEGHQADPQITVEYRGTEQSHLSIALPGVSATHPDRYAMDLMSMILGEGMSSRLFIEVRENRGLAYEIHSSVSHFQDCGALVIGAAVEPRHAQEAVRVITEQLGLLRDGVPEEELARAKRMGAGRLMLFMEDTRAVAGWGGGQELLRRTILEPDEIVSRIEGVTVEDVRRIANQTVIASRMNLAVVGPNRGRKRLASALKL